MSYVSALDIIDPLVQEMLEWVDEDDLKIALTNLTIENLQELQKYFLINSKVQDAVLMLDSLEPMRYDASTVDLPLSHPKLLPSLLQAPSLDLKPLPGHLKYTFIGGGESRETHPVIISNKLSSSEEERLICVLKEFKEAIGWTVGDIKGLSPSTCMHRILLEEGYKPSRQVQRRLNPPMMEVVK